MTEQTDPVAEIMRLEVMRRLSYDRITGIFKWAESNRRRAVAGAVAGGLDSYGYTHICLDGRLYKAHRLAWLIVHGRWPSGEIDHINGIRHDNAITNLREADRFINCQNKSLKSTTSSCGLMGVTRNRSRWQAKISFKKKTIPLGTFDTPEEAHAAYVEAKRKLHPGWAIDAALAAKGSK